MPTIRPFTHILKVFDASPVIDFFTSGAIAHGALVYKLQPFLSLTSVLDSQPHIATRALLAGLVVHVVQLAERGATDLEPDPPEHGHQEKRDGAQAVVTGELRHLRSGVGRAREGESRQAQGATHNSLAGLVVHVVQLAERGATDLEPDPPEHGHQEKRDGAQAVVTGELRHLRRGRSLAREKEG
jgi:hypothetical protein